MEAPAWETPDLQDVGEATGPVTHSRLRGLARVAVAASWMCLGFAGVGAIAATAIYLPLHPGRAAVAPKSATSDAAPARPANFAQRWHDGWTQVAGRIGAAARPAQNHSWLWTDATPSPYATRLTWGDERVAALAPGMTIATPMPVPRPDIVDRPAVAEAPPRGERLASLPPQSQSQPQTPQPSEPGLLDKLFGDPDRAAKAILAAYPNRALYDITKRVVYLPDGTKLEAHSGFGEFIDDPDSMHRKNVGVTPPNVYAVSFREKPFHGVRALRMKPIGDGNMYGRDGILAHSFLLGEAGASNGCISIRDYDTFLKAYEDGQFNQIIVLRSIDEPVPRLLASAQ